VEQQISNFANIEQKKKKKRRKKRRREEEKKKKKKKKENKSSIRPGSDGEEEKFERHWGSGS